MMAQNSGLETVKQFDCEVDNLDAALSLDGRTECFSQLCDACSTFAHNNRLRAQCACGARVNADQWRRINDAVMPGVREAILENSLFTCPGCKKHLLFDYAVVYHAPRHRLLVAYVPEEQEFQQVSRFNAHRYMNAGYQMRFVRSPLGIAEKVLIAEHGLCDISVELFKYLTWGLFSSEGGDKRLSQWLDDGWNHGIYVVDIQDRALSLKAGGETITNQANMSIRTFLGKAYLDQFIGDSFGDAPNVRYVVDRIQNAKGWFMVEWRDIAGGMLQKQ